MRKRGLTRKERREFEGLVRTYVELDAYDPQASDETAISSGPLPEPEPRQGRVWSPWRHRPKR